MATTTDTTIGNSWTKSISEKGEFVRKPSQFRNWVTADGSSGFKAEPGRYHLYVSLACPWAHRTLIVRQLKGLVDAITVNVVDWHLIPGGWRFTPSRGEGCTPDDVNGFTCIREVYLAADPEYSGNFTVPVLYDKVGKTIVSNESAEIIVMLNEAFNGCCGNPDLDLYPAELRAEIDKVNDYVYSGLNNAVYRAGFATAQGPYDEAVGALFAVLDDLESRLAARRYLVGAPSRLTLADVRVFTTLVRFDWVYHQHFKCNLRQLVDYPNLWAYTRDIYQLPGVAGTVNKAHIRKHYMMSHTNINPHGIVPIGPVLDFERPHGREGLA